MCLNPSISYTEVIKIGLGAGPWSVRDKAGWLETLLKRRPQEFQWDLIHFCWSGVGGEQAQSPS